MALEKRKKHGNPIDWCLLDGEKQVLVGRWPRKMTISWGNEILKLKTMGIGGVLYFPTYILD